MYNDLEAFVLTHFQTAIEQRHIQPFYQPVIRTISGKLCSFEALARWVDPERGVISPDEFVPLLEREDLIHLVDQCVIRQVCERLRRSVDAGGIPIPVSVNLSRQDFRLCDIFAAVDGMAREHHVPHDYLYIEITESVMAEREEQMRSVVERFQLSGYQVWMDDFGSAYSSLNALKDYRFDELKLDMQFLSSFSQRSRRILAAVVQMAKDIDIHTLAEGVETEEQFRFLRNIGCEKVQGFLFGKPLPYEDSLSAMRAKGIEIERPAERRYYDDIGRVNLLSAAPFLSRQERDSLTSARQFNSIPLALAEMDADSFSVLFCNAAFEETARDTYLAAYFEPDALGVRKPISLLTEHLRSLLDDTGTDERGRMLFVFKEEYYELRTKRVARMGDRCCILIRLLNLSRSKRAVRVDRLDENVRHILTLFERITLVDLDRDSLEPLYVKTHANLVSGRTGLRALTEEYARRWVFPEDREVFRALVDSDTIERRLREAELPFVTACLRSGTRHGQYAWKQYTVLRVRERRFLLLVRNIHRDLLHFMEEHGEPSGCLHSSLDAAIKPEQLWKALVQSDIINLFWKDKERSFLGASKAFLDYYEFSSLADIYGKNDEEVGWHVHPDKYRDDEYLVIHEGAVVRNMPGSCISRGENRDILANKTPFYDENGEIQGLIGYFIDRDYLNEHDSRNKETARRDLMTGLLNERGLFEETAAFRDEYYLRGTDYVRVHITVDDFGDFVSQHGFSFGDRLLVALGLALKQEFGRTCALGRYVGQHFVMLSQVVGKGDARALYARIKAVAAALHEVDGVPVTVHLSVGYAVFSEAEDVNVQEMMAENSLLADHDDNASLESRMSRATELFRLYDDLPIPFAVYKTVSDPEGIVTDAVLFYANRIFEKNSGLTLYRLLGRSVRELFPTLGERWYELAGRASLGGETVIDRFRFAPTGMVYHVTANQVLHSGYCCFTYLPLDPGE